MGILPCINIFKKNRLLWDAEAVIVMNSPIQPLKVLMLSTSCRLAPTSWDPRQAPRPVMGLWRIVLCSQICVLSLGLWRDTRVCCSSVLI